MPKPTFFNLTESKKQTLLDAVEKEFSRVTLFEASISNIVKSANIPRGSFYQYFEDKEDAYFYLLNKQVDERKARFESIIKKHDGDIFETMLEMFQVTLKELSQGENINFLKNAYLNMTHEVEYTFTKIFNAHGSVEQFQEMSQLLKRDNLNVETDEELFHLMQIIITITFRNLIEALARELSVKEAMRIYHVEIGLLKKGLYNNHHKA